MQELPSTPRPPRVRFEVRAMEDGVRDGVAQFKDVDIAVVTPIGSYAEVEAVASEWIARQHREPYHAELVRAYEAFKAGKEPPVSGIALELCTMFTPAEVKTMKTVGVRAVEDMAEWPDGNLGMFGMGAVRLKQKAQAWLKSAKDSGVAAAELDQLRADLKTRDMTIEGLQEQLAALARRMEAVEGPRPKLGLGKKGEAA
jgi:hypothetical protein